MKVPISTYADVSRRINTIGISIFLGTSAIGMLILIAIGVPCTVAVRDFAGGGIGKLLAMAISIPFVCLPLYLPIIAIRFIDRRIGIRCPECNVSLTLKSLPEKMLLTRKCSNCLSVVLTNDDYQLAPQPSRPWVIFPLFTVLAILVVCFVAAEFSSPLSLFKSTAFWSETGVQLFAFLVIAQGYAMLMKVMRRRWKTEAAADEPEHHTD
ncbi:MAG: hypothetical protein NTX48_06930 [Planctomycetales bacterium]|nr:hypothetical protein [Planctomycetales bacterium]